MPSSSPGNSYSRNKGSDVSLSRRSKRRKSSDNFQHGDCDDCSQKLEATALSATPYNQAIAQQSKNDILKQVRESTIKLENVIANSIYAAAFSMAINVVIVMLLLFMITVIILIYLNIITVYKAIYAFGLWAIFVLIMASIFVAYVYRYSLKKLRDTGHVFVNFVSSEEVLRIINDSAGVYRQVAGF